MPQFNIPDRGNSVCLHVGVSLVYPQQDYAELRSQAQNICVATTKHSAASLISGGGTGCFAFKCKVCCELYWCMRFFFSKLKYLGPFLLSSDFVKQRLYLDRHCRWHCQTVAKSLNHGITFIPGLIQFYYNQDHLNKMLA